MKKLVQSLKELTFTSLPYLLDPRLLGRMANSGGPMPNLELPVLRGGVFFVVLAAHDGWTLEQHVLTDLCRIIDPSNVRRAWGGERPMRALFARVVQAARAGR